MKKIKRLLLKYKEVIMYLIFGVATTLVNRVVYSLLMKTSAVQHDDNVTAIRHRCYSCCCCGI